MPVYQTSIWICDLCGEVNSATEAVLPWSGYTVIPPEEGWEILGANAREKLACPKCLKQEITDIENTDIAVTKVDDVSPVDVPTGQNGKFL